MTKMNKTEVKFQAQMKLLNDGAGAFLYIQEDSIERIEGMQARGMEIHQEDTIELENSKAILAEMHIQFERMKRFFLFTEFQSNH